MRRVPRQRVLFVAFDVLPGESGRAVRAAHTLEALAQLYEVDALTLRAPGLSHIERAWGARLLRTPAAGTLLEQTQAFARAVKRQLAGGDYDAVHSVDPFGGAATLAAKIQHRFKLVYEAVGFPSVELRYTAPELDGDRAFFEALRRDERACLLSADAVIVGSAVTRGFAQDRGAVLERVRVVPAPVDLALYPPVARAPGPPLRVVYAGSQAPWQGLATLFFALKRLGPDVPIRAVVAAPPLGRWQEENERLVREGRIEWRVRLLGRVAHDEVPALLTGAHVAVLPLEKSERNARQGASPQKLVEALGAGLAVVASDLPLVREVVGDAGLYFKPGDERALADRLARLAEDPALVAELGKKARQRASRFDVAIFRAELREAYVPLLGDVRPHPEEAHTAVTGTPTAQDTSPSKRRRRPGPREAKKSKTAPDVWMPHDDTTQVDRKTRR